MSSQPNFSYQKSFNILLVFFFLAFPFFSNAQSPWEESTYPDEAGYQLRIAGMIEQIAQKTFGKKSMAKSLCPDTGLPVYTWALEGETILSPYTGKKYQQGATGYFGPKKRNEQGEIIAFGGDPLKKDLPVATAYLMLHPDDAFAKAYLSIPGNLNQQYHFAAKNWARFYPLLGENMGADWQVAFQEAVEKYAESRRPSDGDREHAFLSRPHDLVGEKEPLLGGNIQDGGTENHKVMWRSSGLLYAQLFPEGSKVSGYSLAEAEKRTKTVIRAFGEKLLETGNGEYDSQIYYPHSLYGFLNLHDFSPEWETRQLATFLLDYYFATYGLKTIDGAIAGAQKRGFLTSNAPNEMRSHLWAWFGTSSGGDGKNKPITSVHQATSSYRPNRIIWDLVHKNVPLPFEAKMARPTYHLTQTNAFQEYFYCSKSFAIGSIAMTMVDNPTQQVLWSLVVRGNKGPISIGGAQPRYLNPAGHSPYTQTIQHKNTIMVMTGQTGDKPSGKTNRITEQRFQHATEKLTALSLPESQTPENLKSFLQQAKKSAATWLFLPKEELQMEEKDDRIFIELEQVYLFITPMTKNHEWLDLAEKSVNTLGNLSKNLKQHKALIINGDVSGYILEVHEKDNFEDFPTFQKAMLQSGQTDLKELAKGKVAYQTQSGDLLNMQYDHIGLRASGSINGKPIDYKNWANGGVYESPYVTIKNGKMRLSNGKESYEVNFQKEKLVYQEVK